MHRPYRDDLAAARSRIETLEHANRHQLCVRCAELAARKRRNPIRRALLGVVLAVLGVGVVIPTVCSIVAEMRYQGQGFHRGAGDS
jgi:hypothetical protein